MRTLIMIVLFEMILTPLTPMSYQTYLLLHNHQIDQSTQWTDAINNGQNIAKPKIFTIIGNVQKFLDDRNIGIGLQNGQYELLYKRNY